MPQQNTGGLLRQIGATTHIQTHGQQLSVVRRASGATAPITTQTLWCIAIADSETNQSVIMNEGDQNAENAQNFKFLFTGDADVREEVDKIAYEGWYYQVANINPCGDQSGTVLAQTARCVRVGKAA